MIRESAPAKISPQIIRPLRTSNADIPNPAKSTIHA